MDIGHQGYQIYRFFLDYEYDDDEEENDDDEEEDDDKTCAWQYPSTGLSTL